LIKLKWIIWKKNIANEINITKHAYWMVDRRNHILANLISNFIGKMGSFQMS